MIPKPESLNPKPHRSLHGSIRKGLGFGVRDLKARRSLISPFRGVIRKFWSGASRGVGFFVVILVGFCELCIGFAMIGFTRFSGFRVGLGYG